MNKLPDITEVEPLSEKDEPMVQDIIAVLRKHNAIDRFGLTLLHQHFDLSDEEVLVEGTDVATRTQTIMPYRKTEVEHVPTIDTAWRLDSGHAVMSCMCIKAIPGHPHLPRPSDQRLKSDVQPLDSALDQILQLRPVSYDYRKDIPFRSLPEGRQLGLIAQQAERIIPECVTTGADGYKQIDYVSLVPLLVAAVQEQHRQIDELQTEIAAFRREARSTELSCV